MVKKSPSSSSFRNDGGGERRQAPPPDHKLSRFHIRFFASVERGGPCFVLSMTWLPILVNLVWVIIYFVERGQDVFRSDGVCGNTNSSLAAIGPTPFFITSRRMPLWSVQTSFAIVNTFVWAPFRFMRRGHSWTSFVFLLAIELLTVFPFLFSMIFFPAFMAYVPTYLRAFIMKREIMFILSPEGVQRRGSKMFLICSLVLDIFAVTMLVLGLFEWSQNNFPIEPLIGTWSPEHANEYACYSFFVCFYWFIVTIATVGYGDAAPLNTASRTVIAVFILLFLWFLPDLLSRLGVIFRLLGDLRLKRFNKQDKGAFIIVDGVFPLPSARQALIVLQPKFHANESRVRNLVVMLNGGGDGDVNGGGGGGGGGGDGDGDGGGGDGGAVDQDEEDDFARLAVDQSGLFCELFVLRGRLVSSNSGLGRSQAHLAKTIYLLPKPNMQEFAWSRAPQQSRRAAMAESREFCLKRDFDQIRRLWALKNRLGKDNMHGVKTVLFHQSNLKLVEPHQPDVNACCPVTSLICLDSFEQRIAACSVLAPGFNTLVALLGLSGAATDKTFVEYDVEADDEMFRSFGGSAGPRSSTSHGDGEEHEDDEGDEHGHHGHGQGGASMFSWLHQRQESVRALKPSFGSDFGSVGGGGDGGEADEEMERRTSSREDAEFVLGLRNTLLLIEYPGPAASLRWLCSQGFAHRVLVLAGVRKGAICKRHLNFNPATSSMSSSPLQANAVKWDFDTKIQTGDYLVCFGETSQLAALHRESFWRREKRRRRPRGEEEEDGEAAEEEEEEGQVRRTPLHGMAAVSAAAPIEVDRASLATECGEEEEEESVCGIRRGDSMGSVDYGGPANPLPLHRQSAFMRTSIKEGDFSHALVGYKEEEAVVADPATSIPPAAAAALVMPTPSPSPPPAPARNVARQFSDELPNLHERHLLDARSRADLSVEEGAEYTAGGAHEAAPGGRLALLTERLQDHVIVYTAAHSSFVYFVKTLRSAGLVADSIPILLMDSKPPNAFHWSEVSLFRHVYFLQGSPFILDDLVRAGFEHARCLVLLVDFRIRYQASVFQDQENLLAEKVANRLKSMLQCETRIITHLVNEEHFEYIQDNELRFMDFSDEENRLAEFASTFQSVWSPIHSESYIAGECFFPSIYLPLFLVCETRGSWLITFLDKLCDVVGTAHGLVLDPDPVPCPIEYGQLVVDRLKRRGRSVVAGGKQGLVIGIFRNYTERAGRSLFRGVLLFPSSDLEVTEKDRLYVLQG